MGATATATVGASGGRDGGRDGGPARRDRRGRDRQEGRHERSARPAPPPVEEKPKPKRLRPGKVHRSALLESVPAEQRPIAEQLLAGGIPAVRQAIEKQNEELKAAGKTEVKPDALLRVAEDLRGKAAAAAWRDRAEAAAAIVDDLDLRDLRSVVNAAGDAGRDDEAKALAAQLREALANRVEKEHSAWLAELADTVKAGRVVRALRLSSRPPKAGAPIPGDVATQLAEATAASLTSETGPDRWATVLDALAYSPVRRRVVPQSLPDKLNADLRATIARLATRLPEIAHIFDIEPDPAAERAARNAGRRGGRKGDDRAKGGKGRTRGAKGGDKGGAKGGKADKGGKPGDKAGAPEAKAAPATEATPAPDAADAVEATPAPDAAETSAAPESAPTPDAATPRPRGRRSRVGTDPRRRDAAPPSAAAARVGTDPRRRDARTRDAARCRTRVGTDSRRRRAGRDRRGTRVGTDPRRGGRRVRAGVRRGHVRARGQRLRDARRRPARGSDRCGRARGRGGARRVRGRSGCRVRRRRGRAGARRDRRGHGRGRGRRRCGRRAGRRRGRQPVEARAPTSAGVVARATTCRGGGHASTTSARTRLAPSGRSPELVLARSQHGLDAAPAAIPAGRHVFVPPCSAALAGAGVDAERADEQAVYLVGLTERALQVSGAVVHVGRRRPPVAAGMAPRAPPAHTSFDSATIAKVSCHGASAACARWVMVRCLHDECDESGRH